MTRLFFDPAGSALIQFMLLGGICVLLNTGADLIAVFGSTLVLRRISGSGWMQRISGSLLIGLGGYVAFGAETRQ